MMGITKMRRSSWLACLLSLAASSAAGSARADDPSEALDQLKQGFALKEQDKCADAMPHFERSYQLDPRPKALLNMADCEQRLGKLVTARRHFTEGRDIARREGDLHQP